VYDAVRRFQSEKPMPGIYIFIAKAPAKTATYDDLKKEVIELVRKAERIR
jgi:RNase P protein component